MINPDTSAVLKSCCGRSPRVGRQFDDTRQVLTRSGLEVLIETGYLAAGIEATIGDIDIPKGSFYHCFKDKEAFGLAVFNVHDDSSTYRLDKFLLDDAVPPLKRMAAFVCYAGQGMEKYQFRRDCLMGNPLQEAPLLPDTFPRRLKAILTARESRMARCLHEAQIAGAIARNAPPDALIQVFWTGWEGATTRAKLCQSAAPLDRYWEFFTCSMTIRTSAQDGASADNPPPTRNTLS